MMFTFDDGSRAWHDNDGLGYRITATETAVKRVVGTYTWRNNDGVDELRERKRVEYVTRYYACVRARSGAGVAFWDFAWKRVAYRTFEAAVAGCQRHANVWRRVLAIQAKRGRRLPLLVKLVLRTRPKKLGTLAKLAKLKRIVPRKTYLTPSPLTSTPTWAPVTPQFVKLLAKARTKALRLEQQVKLGRKEPAPAAPKRTRRTAA